MEGEDHTTDVVRPHRFEHVERGDCVLFEIFSRVLCAETDVGVGCHVKNDIGSGHGLAERVSVQRVAPDECKTGLGRGAVEEGLPPSREIVEDDYRVSLR